MLADDGLAAAAEQAAQDECDDDDIVDLAGDGDEVGYEVEGEGEIAGQHDEERFLPPWHAWIAEQAAAENNAVGDEAGERAGALLPTGDREREHERRVQEEERAEGDERPRPEAHSLRLARGAGLLADKVVVRVLRALRSRDSTSLC